MTSLNRAVAAENGAAATQRASPSFSKDVAPILFKSCVNCHREGEIGARVPLLSYESAKPWAKAIKEQVVTRAMPPWPADPARSLKMRNNVRLDKKDIDTLVAWVEAGAPRGNDADLPPVPDVPPKWLHPNGSPPDAVLSLPEVQVSATGEIPYVQQRVKVPLPTDKWIVAMQVRPGNNALVHHMGITEVSLSGASPADLDALAKVARQMGIADDALLNTRPAVEDPHDSGAYDMLGVYTPGTTFEMYEAGSAKLLKAGNDMYVNFNIHYTTTGKVEKNHSELGLWFGAGPPKHQLFRAPAAVATIIANGRELLTDDPGTKAEGTDVAIPPIPPYADNYELSGITAYAEPMTIYQLQPHAHMRGKDFKYSVIYPDGREVTVLTVPKYDFHWQLAYDLETPLALPAGSKLIVTAHYDNSSKNKHLREAGVDPSNCGPDKEAYFRRQNQSWHEMFSPLVQYSIDSASQSNDSASQSKAGNRAPLPTVEVVGCLAKSSAVEGRSGASDMIGVSYPSDSVRNPDTSRSWVLTNAGSPRITRSQSTSAAVLRTRAEMPLGSHTYRLLGATVFTPDSDVGRRVAVKGVLIEASGEGRLNVTSLQPVAGDCR